MFKPEMISGISTHNDNCNGQADDHDQYHRQIGAQKTKCNSCKECVNACHCCHTPETFKTEILLSMLIHTLILDCFYNQSDTQAEENNRCNDSSNKTLISGKIIDIK